MAVEEWVEVEGASVEIAVKAALEELGISEESKAQVQVIRDPKPGFGPVSTALVRVKPVPRGRGRGLTAGTKERPQGGRHRRQAPKFKFNYEPSLSGPKRPKAKQRHASKGGGGQAKGTQGQAAEDRRNPYLVLGVAYGASIRDVRRGFAKRAKDISNDLMTTYTMEDLNWALYQLEQSLEDADIDVTIYRVPANPSVLNVSPMDSKKSGVPPNHSPSLDQWTNPFQVDSRATEDVIDTTIIDWVELYISSAVDLACIPYPDPE